MAPKQCESHSGVEARLTACENSLEKVGMSLDALTKTIHRWGGIVVGIAALPLLIKLWSLLEPLARASGD